MSPRRHLDDLFSAAYDDELSPIEEARFHAHMQSCAPCAAAYAEFRSTVEALREMPKARMPHVVHLPSTAPVAERAPRPRIGLGWFNLGVVRRFPATAIAGAFVVLLAVTALLHSGSTPTSTSSNPLQGPAADSGQHGSAAGQQVPTTSCTSIVGIAGAGLPASFSQEDLATNPAQPAERLILAAPTLQVTAGKPAVVYAELSVPLGSAANPGAASAPLPARAVLPCVSVSVVSSSLRLDLLPAVAAPQPQGAGSTYAPGFVISPTTTGPLLSFQVPAGLPPGTEVRVVATIPAGYTGSNSPLLTAELTLTTR
ncbi:MAG: zf-HC2 domain-containing protein [Candidatus Dormiibacterota bacterium]